MAPRAALAFSLGDVDLVEIATRRLLDAWVVAKPDGVRAFKVWQDLRAVKAVFDRSDSTADVMVAQLAKTIARVESLRQPQPHGRDDLVEQEGREALAVLASVKRALAAPRPTLVDALREASKCGHHDFERDRFDVTDVLVAAGYCAAVAHALDAEVHHARYMSGWRQGDFRAMAIRKHLLGLERKGVEVASRHNYWSFRICREPA